MVFIGNAILFHHKEESFFVCLFADKWLELKNIILSEVKQIQKAKSHIFSLICEI
jgi:hypothetical protein